MRGSLDLHIKTQDGQEMIVSVGVVEVDSLLDSVKNFAKVQLLEKKSDIFPVRKYNICPLCGSRVGMWVRFPSFKEFKILMQKADSLKQMVKLMVEVLKEYGYKEGVGIFEKKVKEGKL